MLNNNRPAWWEGFLAGDMRSLARAISAAEDQPALAHAALAELGGRLGRAHVVGITGPPGAGKSTLTGRLAQELLSRGFSLGLILVDPSSPFTGGAILGDRLRLPDISGDPRVFVRSMSSRGSMGGLSRATGDAIKLLDAFGKDVILVETVGTGQAETDIVSVADSVVVVAVPGLGDDIQAMKAGILEIADLFIVNKADRDGADKTERELRSMLRLQEQAQGEWDVPVLKTVATSGQGIQEAVDTLRAHYDHSEKSGGLRERRRNRIRMEINDLLGARMLRELRQQMTAADLAAAADRVIVGEITVYQVVDQLWSLFANSAVFILRGV